MNDRPSRHGSEPVPLASALGELAAELDLVPRDVLAVVAQVWTAVVPPALASRSEIRGLRAGRLTVSAADPATAGQLRYLLDTVRAAVDAELGPGTVREIAVTIRPA